MKKLMLFAALAAIVTVFISCGPNVKKNPFPKTTFATITVEGSGKFGVIDIQTNKEILPQLYSNIGYYNSGYFAATDSSGIALFDNTGKNVIPASDAINSHETYFDFSKGKTKGIYFTKEGTTVSGEYETLEVDKAGNIIALSNKLYGVFNPKGEVIIKAEYPFLVFDGTNYNVAKDKNAKRPMIDTKGKINWNLAEAKVFGKDGKLVKKLTAAQAKKIFTAK